ncbi:hypothetical protein B0H19DRAFT_1185497 [Mycena capillaripes]|nr:hypothetical protein B0H19DRAFT_1185497 [Mycena capillaripes]
MSYYPGTYPSNYIGNYIPYPDYPQPGYPHAYVNPQGCSGQRATAKVAPVIPDPGLGDMVGVPIHICAENDSHCVKCNMPQRKRRDALNCVRTSDNKKWLLHNQINVCTRGPNGSGAPLSLRGFNFTVQLPGIQAQAQDDISTWVFNQEGLIAVIGPMVNHQVTVTKPYAQRPGSNNTMVMSRVNQEGPGHRVEYILKSADQHDIGLFAWYRYHDGSIRVWNYHTHNSLYPVLVAWRSPGDWHWHFHENVSELLRAETEVAAIIVICGIVVFNNMGSTLTRP